MSVIERWKWQRAEELCHPVKSGASEVIARVRLNGSRTSGQAFAMTLIIGLPLKTALLHPLFTK